MLRCLLPVPSLVQGYRNPLEQGISYEDMYMPTLDGVTIHGWLLKSPDAAKVCLFRSVCLSVSQSVAGVPCSRLVRRK